MSGLIFYRRERGKVLLQKLKVLIVGRDEPRICDQCFPQILLEPQNIHFPPSIIRGERKTVRVWHLLLRQCADRSYHAKRKTWMWSTSGYAKGSLLVFVCERYTPLGYNVQTRAIGWATC